MYKQMGCRQNIYESNFLISQEKYKNYSHHKYKTYKFKQINVMETRVEE